MIQIWAITLRELRLFSRDPAGLVLLFLLPAVFILVMSVALQGAFSSNKASARLDILALNLDEGETGDGILAGIEETGMFRIVTTLEGRPLDRERIAAEMAQGTYQIGIVIPREASAAIRLDADAAVEMLFDPALSGEYVALIKNSVRNVVFGSMFRQLKKKGDKAVRMKKAAEGARKEIESSTGPFSLGLPLAGKSVGEAASGRAGAAAVEKLRQRKGKAQGAEVPPQAAPASPVPPEERMPGLQVRQAAIRAAHHGELTPNSVQQSVPGFTVFALFWMAQILALNLLHDRASGSYARILVAPVSLLRYAVGKMVPFFLVNLGQAVFLFALGIFILPLFGCPSLAIPNPFGVFVVTAAVSLAALSFGLFLAGVSKSGTVAATLSAMLLIIMTMLAGIMVPRFVMPELMRKMGLLVPHCWGFDAYLKVLVRDSPTVDVLPEAGMLVLFSGLFFLLALWRLEKLARN
jgi:ABC-2 type transport system permease protein